WVDSGDAYFMWASQLPTVFFFFGAGMLLALLRAAWAYGPPKALTGVLGSADCWFLLSLPFWALAIVRRPLYPFVAFAAFLVIASCALPLRRGWSTRVFE